jgi:hypothetical protein
LGGPELDPLQHAWKRRNPKADAAAPQEQPGFYCGAELGRFRQTGTIIQSRLSRAGRDSGGSPAGCRRDTLRYWLPDSGVKNSYAETAVKQTSEQMHYRPEFELLLCSARTMPDSARMEKLVEGRIDWRAFFELASHHGVRLLVYRSLREACWERVPTEVQTEWHDANQSLTGKTLFLAGELLRVTAEFEAAAIPVAVMKGAALAQMVYRDVGLREFSDLDLLIHETDFSRALDLLRRLSYEPVWKCDQRKALQFLRHVGEYAVRSDLSRAEVDLHWRVATKATALSPGVSDLPSGFRPVEIAGSTVLSFAPQGLPLYLAAQGGWDQWCELRRICDVTEFLRRYPQVDWEPSLEAAQRLGGLRSMLVGLSLASRLLGAELPGSVVSRIRADGNASLLVERTIRKLEKNVFPSEAISRYVFQIRAKQGMREKIALAYSILMDRTAKDGQWIMLPRPLWWLYGFVRPLRMSAKLFRLD